MIKELLCEKTRKLWHVCLLDTEAGGEKTAGRFIAEAISVIGIEKNLLCMSFEEMTKEAGFREFSVVHRGRLVDEWYECIPVSEEVYLVAGAIWITCAQDGQADECLGLFCGGTELDTRFSVLWKKEEDDFRIIHIHHSLPSVICAAQTHGCQTHPEGSSTLEQLRFYKNRAEKDLMTETYNRSFFEIYVRAALRRESVGIFHMIDLDDFKKVNDTFGHVTGDKIIKDMADILKSTFEAGVLLGRLGGDEFAVYDSGMHSREEVEDKAVRILENYKALSSKYGGHMQLTCSIGLCRVETDAVFEQIYRKADSALYFSKNTHKGTFHWYYKD